MTICPQAWPHLQQQLRRSISEMITSAKKKVSNLNDPKKPRRTVLNALKLAERVLNGPCTPSRVSTARLSLALSCGAFKDEELTLLAQRLQKMELLSTGIRKRLEELTDCEVFYWHKTLLHTYLGEAGQRHYESDRLSHALRAVQDCQKALNQAKHVADPVELIKLHESFIRRALDRNILEPLCTAVETELRIQSHSNLPAGLDRNPFKSEMCTLPGQLNGYVSLGRQDRLCVSIHVEQYLGQTFYNLAALASHDWRKYSQMR